MAQHHTRTWTDPAGYPAIIAIELLRLLAILAAIMTTLTLIFGLAP